MEANKCCVPGCCGMENLLEFPDPKTQLFKFRAWISFIGSTFSSEAQCIRLYKEYKEKRMCNIHFSPMISKTKNGDRTVVYTVPHRYGPRFWDEYKKKIGEKLNNTSYDTIVLKENNSILSKENVGIEPKRRKVTVIGATNNTTNTTITKTTPLILRKKDPPLIPVVQVERMETSNLPIVQLKQVETSVPVVRLERIETSNLPDPNKPESAVVHEKALKTYGRSTRSKASPRDSQKSRMTFTEDKTESEEDATDTDDDFEAEYLDSDSDSTESNDCEVVPQEIEYLDMDKLESDDNQKTPSGNMVETKSRSVQVYAYNSVQEIPKSNAIQERKLNSNDISKPKTEIIKSIQTDSTKTYTHAYSKLLFSNTRGNVKFDDLLCDSKKQVNSGQQNNNNCSTEIISVGASTLETPEVDNNNDFVEFMDDVYEEVTVESVPEQPIQINQPAAHKEYIPVLKVDSQSVSAKQVISNSPDDDTIRTFLAKHKLKPLEHNTNTENVNVLQPNNEVKIPMEILNQAKELAAKSLQNRSDPTSKRNIYILDSTGSVITKEEVPAKVTSEVPFAPNQIQQNRVPQESKINLFTSAVPLTSKERVLKLELQKAKRQLKILQATTARLKRRVKQLNHIMTHPKFLKVIDNMPRIARIITAIQFKTGTKKKRGRRFTEEEKEIAIALREQCPSAYKYMVRMGFVLPSSKSLCKIKLKFESTIDSNDAIEKLKDKVRKMPHEHRLCALLFDEKLLSPSNRNRHVVTAFGSEGEQTEVTFEADHALIFMVRGIVKNYQEPVSFTFSFGPTSGQDLATHIKNVISDLQVVGYKILATVCDHADNNRTAIEILTKKAESDYYLSGDNINKNVFKINDEEIIPLYDPPHLLKGIRNNLISKHLRFQSNGLTIKTAKWRHLEMLLSENPEYREVRLIPKLTESHVYPTKQGITKVKFASQIFSQTVAVYMGYLAEKGILPLECRDTAELLLFFDQLFDSFNGHSAIARKNSKPLLLSVKPNSEHHNVWKESLNILKTMQFVNNGAVVSTPDVYCWIWTIEGYKLLVAKLFDEHKLESVWMRHINQDVLERLFRMEINPTPTVRAKNIVKQTTRITPGWFAGEVVTQKVIKAINRINKEEKKECL